MLYEQERALCKLSFQHWKAHEVFSTGWFMIVGVLLAAYVLWGFIGDKSKASKMLLIGALAAVAYSLNSIFMGTMLGLAEYRIRLFPTPVALFVSSITLSPIVLMLSEQSVSDWKEYLLRTGIGFAFLNFVIFKLYEIFGIVQFHGWNVFYHFLELYGISIGVRFVFLLIGGVEKNGLRKKFSIKQE